MVGNVRFSPGGVLDFVDLNKFYGFFLKVFCSFFGVLAREVSQKLIFDVFAAVL